MATRSHAQHRVLLTSVCTPFGGPGEGDSVGAELFHKQVTRAQGPFSLRQTIRVWGLDFIAENIEAPAVTLHYPTFSELARELREGDYTVVGVNFVVATFHKLREVVNLVRELAPDARIVLGGYGTVLPDDILRPYADAICREEGVGFMRRFLGEPMDGPIRQPHAPIPSVKVLSHQRSSVVGHVTAGLGCSNACDFCCTSHFFKRKYVPFLETGRDIYDAMMATRARAEQDGADMKGYILIDEDFFIHRKRALQFLDCVREGGKPLSIMGFGSVRGLSQFTAREIAEMGFDVVWNAFEGAESGYTKQKGRPMAELYADLKSVGTATLTSMIIGFPYQDEATMDAEFEQLMELEPALMQCLIYFAFPGTPFHEQVIAEKRYLDVYQEQPDLRRWDGFSMHFKHPKIADPGRIEDKQREFYRRDFERLGPGVMRLSRVWLQGYLTLRGDDNPLLAARAERLRVDARAALPALSAVMRHAPSEAVRSQAQQLQADLVRHTGAMTLTERAMSAAAPLLHPVTDWAQAAGVYQQPGLLRTEHRTGHGFASQRTQQVLRLQGGRFSKPIRSLLDASAERLRALRPNGSTDQGLPLNLVTSAATGMPRSLDPSACGDAVAAGGCAMAAPPPRAPVVSRRPAEAEPLVGSVN